MPIATRDSNRRNRPLTAPVLSCGNACAQDLELGAELEIGLSAAGVKRARKEDKEAKYEAFKRQQRLHPEYAGVYADTFLSSQQQMHHYKELRVFLGRPSPDAVVGLIQYQPHNTVRELRTMLQSDLGMVVRDEEQMSIFRATYTDGAVNGVGEVADATGTNAADVAAGLRCPIPLTQNHKLVHPLFPHPAHVLVVELRELSALLRPNHLF